MKKIIYNHLLMWLFCVLILSIIYSFGLPGFGCAVVVILMLLPVHMLYYYGLSSLLIPNYLKKRNSLRLILGLLGCAFLAALLFRLIEILIADPYIYRKFVSINPQFRWKKLEGTFMQQLLKPIFIINAFEQSNTLVWVAISIKYFKLWFEKRQLSIQSELNFLKAKLHPHFLFNTLNNLYALSLNNSPKSPKLILGFSSILRYMLYECDSDTVSLTREVEIIQNYIALEKLRYEERLDIHFSINGEISQEQIPPLLLFPLVENAFIEGTSETIDGPWINIDMEINHKEFKFKVANSKQPQTSFLTSNFALSGFKNLKKRLEMQFPSQHELEVFEDEEMFVVVMQLNLNQHF